MRPIWNRARIRESLQKQKKLRVSEAGGGGGGRGGSSTGTFGVAGATTGANVGAFEVPLGGVLRRKSPAGEAEDEIAPKEESLERNLRRVLRI
jgi:hypothetical protein